jgi:hypothetical protein
MRGIRLLTAAVLASALAYAQIPPGGSRMAIGVGPRSDTLPATCGVGQLWVRTGSTNPGLYHCGSTNTWSILATGSGAGDAVMGAASIGTTGNLIPVTSGVAGTLGVSSLKLLLGYFYPTYNSTSAIQFRKADGTTPFMVADSTNGNMSLFGTGTVGSESLAEGNFTGTTKWAGADDMHLAGAIASVTLVAPGTGYAVGDTLSITQTGSSASVITVASITGGGGTGPIDTVTITNGGASYYAATALATTTLTGTGSAATFTIASVTATQVRYVHTATNSGTITQTSANMTLAGVASMWYKLTYTLSSTSPGDSSCYVTTAFATENATLLTGTANVKYFQAKTSGPGNFVIGCSGTSGIATLDDLSLQEVQGGNLTVGGTITARTLGLTNSFGIGTSTPVSEFQVNSTVTTSPRGIMSSQSSTGVDGARFHMRKMRGTLGTPLTVVTGDNLGRLVASGYDGANFLEMGSIIFGTEGTIASTRVPTNIQFHTATDAAPSVLTERMRIDSAGNVGIGTTNPLARLGVAMSSGVAFNMINDTSDLLTYWSAPNGKGIYNYLRNGANNRWVWGKEYLADDFFFERWTGGSGGASQGVSFIIQNSSGNVGINTAAPAEKLDVKGNAIIYDSTATTGSTTLTVKAGPGQSYSPLYILKNSSDQWLGAFGYDGAYTAYSGGVAKSSIAGTGFQLTSGNSVIWKDQTDLFAAGNWDTGLARASAGVLEVNTGTAGTLGKLNAAPGGYVPACQTVTVPYTDAIFLAAATTADKTLIALPARAKVQGVTIKSTVAFAGTAVSSTTVSVGNGASTYDQHASPYDIFQAVGDTVFQDSVQFKSTTMAGYNLSAHFIANTNFGNGAATVLTAGSVAISACWVVLP